MSLTDTTVLATAALAVLDAEMNCTNSIALRFPPAMPSFSSTLQFVQSVYETKVQARTPGAVGALSPAQ